MAIVTVDTYVYVNVSLTKKYILNVTAITIEYARTYDKKKKKNCDASLMYMYLVSIFKANIFLPRARSHKELALFSLNNITLIILIYLASAYKIFYVLSVFKCWL